MFGVLESCGINVCLLKADFGPPETRNMVKGGSGKRPRMSAMSIGRLGLSVLPEPLSFHQT
eukprot:7713715-Lingulodinium_polyedra.AAC.1